MAKAQRMETERVRRSGMDDICRTILHGETGTDKEQSLQGNGPFSISKFMVEQVVKLWSQVVEQPDRNDEYGGRSKEKVV